MLVNHTSDFMMECKIIHVLINNEQVAYTVVVVDDLHIFIILFVNRSHCLITPPLFQQDEIITPMSF